LEILLKTVRGDILLDGYFWSLQIWDIKWTNEHTIFKPTDRFIRPVRSTGVL